MIIRFRMAGESVSLTGAFGGVAAGRLLMTEIGSVGSGGAGFVKGW